MKLDIILAGVGGQGILTIATVIGEAALAEGLHIKQAEVHGMSQRGGDVHSNMRISSDLIHSDLVGKGSADVVISLEPMEALRYAAHLKPQGWIVSSLTPVVNITNYPSPDEIIARLRARPHTVLVDADALAQDCGAMRSANIVLLGAASGVLGIDYAGLEEGIRNVFSRKGEAVVEANLKALAAGRRAAAKG
ncbi:indolepyruvate oxidoreductase [Bacteroidia bacterium]|nr:indolepyruvate oxidoreductase [Bacteroidia bacterium]